MGRLENGRKHVTFLHLLSAEMLKMRRTWILWLHIVMPVLGIAVFLWYYSFSMWSAWGKISGYIEIVSIVCPVLVSFVSALAAEQEKQAGHFQNLFGTGRHRESNLAIKICLLMLWNLAALTLAVGGFGAGFSLMTDVKVPGKFYPILILVTWVCQTFCYCFHLFLGIRFSRGISIGAGVVESLVAALMMTGLGDGIWQFLPCAWAGRFTGYYVQMTANADINKEFLRTQIETGGIVMLLMTLAGAGLLFIWFHNYEGRRVED